jgi:hypothetical protein
MIVGLIFFVTISGCANRFFGRSHTEDSLLQANRRLEEALVVTHNQLVDLKRENEALKAMTAENAENNENNSIPLPLIQRNNNIKLDVDDPPISLPQVIIPEGKESTTVPDSLKGTSNEMLPSWTPHR